MPYPALLLVLSFLGDMHEELKPTAPFTYPEIIPNIRVRKTYEGVKIRKCEFFFTVDDIELLAVCVPHLCITL